MKNTYLVGFMGTGKSTVGKELSAMHHMRFVDMDEVIEYRQKRQIADIFAKEGEAFFRQLEKSLLQELAGGSNAVVSCGGGIVLDPANIALMKQTGLLVCLTARPDVVLDRTRRHTNRPLLNVPDPRAKIAELLANRAPLYAQAEVTVDTSSFSIHQVAEAISRHIA